MRNLRLDPNALEDLQWWVRNDHRTARKILELMESACRDPFKGHGTLEALRFELAGCWSRRITLEHRLVYEVTEEDIRVLACRYHYR
ncbi:Txe/YoeB family addiction module toxin [Nitrosococcus oceani]|uniref:Txe/YoeB family addiction module toxin n=1 Tax=Nitrosococcus oceani TaxID=1229 RepID=UPI0004E886F1|nr:Txe/YoeB family addiction module toxin [Nitrosococcus oceani]KFI21817.1 addiction module protein [Nitrosococcus oceani]